MRGNKDDVASVSSRVTIPASQTIGAFRIVTSAVPAPTAVTISATLNGETKEATFTVLAE